MSNVRDRLLSASKKAQTLSSSKEYNYIQDIPTAIPALNLLLSGEVNKGITPGITCWAGPSRHFKSLFCLVSAKAYKDKFPDATIVMFDSEYGSPPNYIKSIGLDPDEVVHIPIDNYEELKFEANKVIKAVEPGDNVFIIVDSLGNLASAKEAKDADDEKSVADMTRAKEAKSFFRIVTPLLKRRNMPMHVVQHTYESMCLDENTLIKTLEGQKVLREVMVGDVVYTTSGTQKVTQKFNHEDLQPEDKTYIEIEFDDGSVVRCTHNHRFLLFGGKWCEAQNLRINDVLG